MKIGELSKRTKLSIDTLRFYAKEGLLDYTSRGNYWDFDENQVEQAQHIILLRKLDFSVKEIHYVFHASQTLLVDDNVQKDKLAEYKAFFKMKLLMLEEQSKQIKLAEKRIDKIIGKLTTLEEGEAFQ